MGEIIPIEGIGFYSSGTDAEWEFSEYEDATMDIALPANYSHGQAWVFTNGFSMTFKVRAKEDARILLMEVRKAFLCGTMQRFSQFSLQVAPKLIIILWYAGPRFNNGESVRIRHRLMGKQQD